MVGGSSANGLGSSGSEGKAIAIQSNGKIVVGGQFTQAGGFTGVRSLARFNQDGSSDTNFNKEIRDNGGFTLASGGTGLANDIALQDDGQGGEPIVAVGAFQTVAALPAVNRIAGLLIGGNFISVRTVTPVNGLARIESIGKLDLGFVNEIKKNTGMPGEAKTLALTSGEKMFIGGSFLKAGDVNVNRMAQFNVVASLPLPPAPKVYKPKKPRSLKVKGARSYRFTVRVVASNQKGKSSAAAKAFRMRWYRSRAAPGSRHVGLAVK